MSLATVACPLYQAAQRWGEAPALCEGGRITGFATLQREVAALASGLCAQGVRPGQRIALVSEDRGGLVRWLLACLRLGACAIVLNPRFPTRQLQQLLERGQAQGLFDPDGRLAHAGIAKRLLPATTGEAQQGIRAPQIDPSQPLTGVFTSGSSGAPKLALHSLTNHRASAEGSLTLIPLSPGDRWALTLPLYHIGGLAILFRCLFAGACLQLPAADQSLEQLLTSSNSPSHLSLVTTQLLRLQAAGIDLAASGLRYLLLGGGPCGDALLAWLKAQRLTALISYGLTEMSSQVMTGPVNADARLARLLPGRELILGEDGEILVRGQTLFLGYFNNGRLSRPLDQDGWFHTRDRGELDSDGTLRVCGRCDNQFISGGENIQPEEIESLISCFEGVSENYVVPVPDPEYGQRPVAFVRWQGQPNAAELLTWLRQRLPGYKVPRQVLPLTAEAQGEQLKVNRRRLSELALQQRERVSPGG